jgi:hypothetical protein
VSASRNRRRLERLEQGANPFEHIPKTMLPIIGGICDHPDDKRASCAKCSLTVEINRLIDAGLLPPEKLFHVLVRLAAELIGGSSGGPLKHHALVTSFVNLLQMTVKVVEGQAMEEGRGGREA